MPTGSSATPGATTSIRAPASKPVSKTLPQVYTENGSEMPVSDPVFIRGDLWLVSFRVMR